MTIAHQAEVLGVANTGAAASNYDTSITPAAAPNGVVVVIVDSTAVTDAVTSVTYGVSTGAVPLTRRRLDVETTEPGGVQIWWAGGVPFPSGAQTVRVVKAAADNIRAYVATMTCAAGMQIAVDSDAVGTSASVANPSWVMTTIDPTTACYLGIHSGIQTMLNTPAANWTLGGSPGFEDVGAIGRGWARRSAVAAGNQLPGWTLATADDYIGSSVAFRESPLALNGIFNWYSRPNRPARMVPSHQPIV